MDQQMKLDIDARRSRVRLLGDEPKPRRRVLLIDHAAVEEAYNRLDAMVPLTPWMTYAFNRPPVSGYWDVRIRHTHGTVAQTRAKYHADLQGWEMPKDWKYGIGGLEWRGLAYDPEAGAL